MGAMGPVDFGRSMSAALDPVLGAAGFAAGQGGGDQVIFCAAHDELSDRYPSLPQSDKQSRGMGGCIDLVVHGDEGRFRSADLEGVSLDTTLRLMGEHEEADAVARQGGGSLDEVLPVLTRALIRLFGAPASDV